MFEDYVGTPPDGRPLYAYRLTQRQFDRTRESLRREIALGRYQLAPDDAALLCLYGAEWWRRKHVHGPWSWHGIRCDLEIDWPYQRLIDEVARGLGRLHRPILMVNQMHRYLATLACEGGLPLRRLEASGANIRAYFRALIEHGVQLGFATNEGEQPWVAAAEQRAGLLPLTVRHPVVYQLAGRLIHAVWELREVLGEPGPNPIRALDAHAADWRDRLPLQLDDGPANALLRGLVTDLAQVVRGERGRVRFVTQLLARGDRVSLVRSLVAPALISRQAARDAFGELPDGQRFIVRAESEDGDGLRLGAMRSAGDAGWHWQPAEGSRLEAGAAAGRTTVTLASRSHGIAGPIALEGGTGLGEWPWVFRQVEHGEWELIATASVRRRESELVVALPVGWREDVGDVDAIGAVLDRRLYRVQTS